MIVLMHLPCQKQTVDGIHHCYDILRDNALKETGVNMVLAHLNISKESAIAYGDGLNDKEMLMCVEESFTMGNSHPDLFSYLKYITTDVWIPNLQIG
ncbi:MAG: HAD hydrolase family protein [Bacillus sp. (in: Bacteria)]|nr:HAD hydrolase family protein [Bacillus sp. (in: firmicutes)]